jgi:hypothetical protein
VDRREFLSNSALIAAAAALPVGISRRQLSTERLGASKRPPVSVSGCLWGAHANPRGGQDPYSAITKLEADIGRKFVVDRQYQVWNDLLPTKYVAWTSNQGRIPYVGWHAWMNTPSGPAVTWKSIASGARDTWIRQQANSIKKWGRPMYLCFHHEPEDDKQCGNAADYRAAYNHVWNVFDQVGVPNVTWVMSLMAFTFYKGNGGPEAWEPAHYDVIGVDGYNRAPCLSGKEPKSFERIFAPARAFAQKRKKPLAIAEWGSVEANACGHTGDPMGKGKWITNAAATIESWPEVIWASYSHVTAKNYAFWVDTSSHSMDAFTAVGKRAYFKPAI